MTKIEIPESAVMKIAQEALPSLLKEAFTSNYSNPLKEILDEIVKSDEMKSYIGEIIEGLCKDIASEADFKVFVKESLVNEIVRSLQKRGELNMTHLTQRVA